MEFHQTWQLLCWKNIVHGNLLVKGRLCIKASKHFPISKTVTMCNIQSTKKKGKWEKLYNTTIHHHHHPTTSIESTCGLPHNLVHVVYSTQTLLSFWLIHSIHSFHVYYTSSIYGMLLYWKAYVKHLPKGLSLLLLACLLAWLPFISSILHVWINLSSIPKLTSYS